MTPEEAEDFYEDDEDPEVIFAAFDAALATVLATTTPPVERLSGLAEGRTG